LSTCRKFRVSITACIQNLTQLKKIYGEIDGDELRELFKTIVFCGGLKDSAQYFSDMLGTTEVKQNNITTEKPLMTASQIRQMKTGKMMIITKNKKPVQDDMIAV
jgi:type IV secretory pathway TraG/TraD family ATPase VirD4